MSAATDIHTESVITSTDPLVNALLPILSRVRIDTCWIAKRGKSPRCIKEPLTEAKLFEHLNNGPRYGVAPFSPGTSVTRVGLLDFDSHRGETNWIDMKVIVMGVMKVLRDLGASPIPFKSSGGRGAHLYLLWDEPQDAYSVRCFLRDTLKSAGLTDGTKGVSRNQVEIFPKQDAVAEGKFGNMFILPLAGHSCPLDPVTLDDMDKANAPQIQWPASPDVPTVIRPETPIRSTPIVEGELSRLSSALDAIPYADADQFGYQRWLNYVLAIHHASDGSTEGQCLAHSFFSRAAEYNEDEIDRLWEGSDSTKVECPVTAATIYQDAYMHGWYDPSALDGFEDLTLITVASTLPLPLFIRNGNGEVLSTMDNMAKGVGHKEVCGMNVAYDAFRDEIMYSSDDGENWVPFKDADYIELRINLERRGFKSPVREITRDAVLYVAEKNKFDSAQVWLNRLPWDGVERVHNFMSIYIGTEDTPYHHAVSRYLWTALAGRVLSPGCKADMAPVLVGKQGTRKSSAVAAISPDPMFFAEISFSEKDDDLSRKMRGRLVAEIAELKGLHSKDEEHVKAWITKQFENWTPKYREFNTIFPRRLVFVGTTNREEFLSDDTGNRRWLPVRVDSVIDVDRITRDCLQLWAEARELFNAGGVDYKEAEALAVEVHAEHMISDPWEPIVVDWLDRKGNSDFGVMVESEAPPKRDYLQTHEVLEGALGLDKRNCGRSEQMRIGKVLSRLGYERKKMRVGGGSPSWVFVPTVPTIAAILPQGGNKESP